MDGLTMKVALTISALLLIGFLFLVWKFFAKAFKHVVIMLFIGAALMTFFYFRYRSLPPPASPYKGKHAYIKANGEYIGVVEAEGEDSRRGKVWIIRPVGGYPQKYSKLRVELKDKMELKPEPTPTPTPESKPTPDKPESKPSSDKAHRKKKN
jgi:hypothetical protein